jgi:molybdopterin molybdotransferase
VTHNLDSQTGREDFIPCRLVQREGEEWADPVFGKSNLIFTLVRADGLLVVPGDANGVAQGEWVEFLPFDV